MSHVTELEPAEFERLTQSFENNFKRQLENIDPDDSKLIGYASALQDFSRFDYNSIRAALIKKNIHTDQQIEQDMNRLKAIYCQNYLLALLQTLQENNPTPQQQQIYAQVNEQLMQLTQHPPVNNEGYVPILDGIKTQLTTAITSSDQPHARSLAAFVETAVENQKVTPYLFDTNTADILQHPTKRREANREDSHIAHEKSTVASKPKYNTACQKATDAGLVLADATLGFMQGFTLTSRHGPSTTAGNAAAILGVTLRVLCEVAILPLRLG